LWWKVYVLFERVIDSAKEVMATNVFIDGTKRQIVGFIVMLALVMTSVMPSHAHGTAHDELSVSMACNSNFNASHDHSDALIDSHSHEEQGSSDNCCVAFCIASEMLPAAQSLLKGGKMIHLSRTVLERISGDEISLHRPPAI